MTTISEAVEALIRKSPFLEEAIGEGLINISALARTFQDEVEEKLQKKVNPGALVMAINRLSLGGSHKTLKAIQMASGIGDIVVRSDLHDFTYSNSSTLIEKEARLLELVSLEKEAFCTFSQGVYETTIIVSTALADRINTIFRGENLLSQRSKLSSITMKLPSGNTEVSGIYYYIMKRIAWEGIAVVELISTTNEFTLVVNDRDVNRSFAILMNLKAD